MGLGLGVGEEAEQSESEEESDAAVSASSEADASDEDADSDSPEVGMASAGPSRQGPAWVDPDDAKLSVSLASNKRLRKLRDALAEDEVGGKEYERKLRRQFEKINPTPSWANKARAKLHGNQKRRRPSRSSDEESLLEDNLPELLTSTAGIIGPKSKTLPQGTLAIERLRDANLSAPSEGAIKAVQFHPSAQVPVMLTASEDRRLRLFNVSTLIQCVAILGLTRNLDRWSHESAFANHPYP